MSGTSGTSTAATSRRVVIGTGEDGRSRVVEDERLDAAVALPPFSSVELWRDGVPADLTKAADGPQGEWALVPATGGFLARIVELRPDAEWKSAEPTTDVVDADGFHRTDTLDLVVVLDGEVRCVADDGEVWLQQGDVLVQIGTNHAWSVRGERPCRILAVLVDGRR